MALPRRRRAATVSERMPMIPSRVLGHWSRHYNTPDFNSMVKPREEAGVFGILPKEVTVNTKNSGYPPKSCRKVKIWHIPPSEIDRYQAVWNLPFDLDSLPKHVRPLDDFASNYATPFHHEDALVARLSATIFSDLQRVLWYIRDVARSRVQSGGSLYPTAGHRALISEHGSAAYAQRGYCPDRCALAEPFVVDHGGKQGRSVGWLMGDVKKSSSWRSTWIGSSSVTQDKYWAEYRKPLCQVKCYSLEYGIHYHHDDSEQLDADGTTAARLPIAKAVRYGFIITDQELVLLRRDLEEKDSIYVSQAFPLRRAQPIGDQDVPNNYISAMTALLYIHFLAGDPSTHDSARPDGGPRLGGWHGSQAPLSPTQWE